MLPLWKKAGREAGLLRSKFDDDCIWMIRNAPYLSCPNWEDRRKSLTHIFTFVVAWSCFSTKQDATRGCYAACMPACRKCAVALRHNALVAAQTTAWSQHCTRMLRKYTRHETSKTFRKFHLKYQVENASQSSWKFAQLELEHQYLLTFLLKIFLIFHEILSRKF